MFLTWSVCVSFVFCRRAEKVPGQCAVLQRDGRFVYYLVRSSEWTHTHRWHKRHSIWNVTVIVTSQVTKKRASQKPTYDSLTRSLEDMKSHCLRNEVTKISMPRFVFSFPLWLSATLSVSRLLRLQFKKNVSFFSHFLINSIGCGLDRLEWRRVAVILEQVFKHTNISITVYSLPAKAQTAVMKENWRRWWTEVCVSFGFALFFFFLSVLLTECR